MHAAQAQVLFVIVQYVFTIQTLSKMSDDIIIDVMYASKCPIKWHSSIHFCIETYLYRITHQP